MVFSTRFLIALRIHLRTQNEYDYNKATMKKKFLVLLALPLLFCSLTSCSDTDGTLSYGTYIEQDLNSLKTLSNEDLVNKTKNEKETFLLATYQSSHIDDCLCWPTFLNVIVKYSNEFHEMFYLYDTQSKDESVSNLKIESFSDSTPCFYIFKGEKQLAKYSYKNNKDKDLFGDTSLKLLDKTIHKVVHKPYMFYVDRDYLAENLSKTKQVAVLFMRSGCSDCSYVIPNVLIPYINDHAFAKDIWLFDMQYYYDMMNNEPALEGGESQYQSLKNKYGLSASSNQTYGYQQGVVPTLQYYVDGVLTDATVFFNDVIGQKEDGSFYVSDSYYTSERLPNLRYMKGFGKNSILKDMTVSSDNVGQTKSGNYFWMQKDAAKYHTPILKAFLDYYMF